MIIPWEPIWYALDQTIVAGDTDYFYLDKKEKVFINDFPSDEDKEVYGQIVNITHPELGELPGILTMGLSYKIYLKDSKYIQVDAEERTGIIEYPEGLQVNEWIFTVELKVLEVTGFTSEDRLQMEKDHSKKLEQRKEKYMRLLGGQINYK